ncbi:hypothetical protein M378DRAFT_24959 [Amanita muscaria Koide BX008]|uniref:Protein kinase domain-containing protein n=1 Tax=Amanita muscaria (strain Koide BX008) TaxID=946122 RepID=A0A0C2SK53_AMAMK|nr:hypothetical protein M378DRAFT_24959 [Amanita muscaria Koide BX008]
MNFEPWTLTTDISEFEAGLLEQEWKAGHAVRDDSLVQKLCHSLKNILGDTLLAAGSENYLLASFSPQLQVSKSGRKDRAWDMNPNEAKSRSLLNKGFFEAARKCLEEFGPYDFATDLEDSVKGGTSKALCEAKSSSVMKKVGAILSVVKGVPVEPSAYRSDMKLDTIEDDDSGAYRGSLDGGATTSYAATHDEDENTESELMVTSSSPNSPEDFQVWLHLHSMSNNTLVLPQCARSSKQRLWLARFLASGSTGNVWQCRFDNCDDLFAVKVVELLRPSDAGSQQRLRNEFNAYRILDKAHQSGQLRDRIAPRCYGAFEGNRAPDPTVLIYKCL